MYLCIRLVQLTSITNKTEAKIRMENKKYKLDEIPLQYLVIAQQINGPINLTACVQNSFIWNTKELFFNNFFTTRFSRMQFSPWTIAVLFLECFSLVEALIDTGDLPLELGECFQLKTEDSNVTEVPSEDICITCITDYLWKHGTHRHCFNKTEHDLTWVAEILTELHPVTSKRQKRTPPKQRRRRKEYRMLSDKEREKYHLAINRMKRDRVR